MVRFVTNTHIKIMRNVIKTLYFIFFTLVSLTVFSRADLRGDLVFDTRDNDGDGWENVLEKFTGGDPNSPLHLNSQNGCAECYDSGLHKYYIHRQTLSANHSFPSLNSVFYPDHVFTEQKGISGEDLPQVDLQTSVDLENWSDGVFSSTQFIPDTINPDGTRTFSAISPYYLSATSSITSVSWYVTGDLEEMTLESTALALPNAPYSLPNDSVTLINDLANLGYTSTLSHEGVEPLLTIESVYTSITNSNQYHITVDGVEQGGTESSIALDGKPILRRQFTRLKITP